MSKFESSRLNREFRAIKERFSEPLNGKVVIGVSGGADSMCLLYLLHRSDIETVVVHCNYQMRGKSSDQDQQLVEKICGLWGFDCVSLRLNPREAEGGNFQSWARDERYRIFREIKEKENATLILTAHHEDDQIETILQKMLRGSGIGSWKGMDLLDDDLFRPLLQVSKSEIMEFVQDFNIPYRIDSSNEESTYARNFIRNNWFPELNKLFPGWKENLLRIQNRAREFELMADHLIENLTEEDGKRIDREKLLNMDRLLWPVIIHRVLQKKDRDLEISRGFLLNLNDLEKLQTGKSIQISDQLSLIRDRSYFVIKEGDHIENSPESLIVDQIPENGFNINNLKFTIEPWEELILDKTLQLDYDKMDFPLRLRNWESGDQIRPLGMEGSQLISNHLTNQKVSAVEKKEAKVLASFDGTIYAVIFPSYLERSRLGTISETVKCGPKTKKTLIIRNT